MQKIGCTVLLLLLSFSLFAFNTRSEAFTSLPFVGVQPIVQGVGQTEDPLHTSTEAVEMTYRAFSSFYTLQWYEQYVAKDSVSLINKTYDSLLARILPASVILGKPVQTKSYVVVPLLVATEGQENIFLELTWQRDEEGTWKIVNLRQKEKIQ
ncbi:MAG: hypothetical protein ACOXZ4_05265 [Sphaerochaetaceae bacterium]|jgi:hypothetical protein